MPDDSNGNHSLPVGYLAVTGQKVLPSNHNPPLEDISAALTARFSRDGRAPLLGNMNANSNKIYALANGVDPGDAVNRGQLDDLGSQRIRFLNTGVSLPTSNVGPIYHADYASLLTWQVYSSNGASYAGYASVEVGMPGLEGQLAPRTGYLKRNGASVSKATYAALWNWAVHNGRSIALGSWTAGPFVFADNGDGTFRLPDQRGEFERLWDDSRGVDSGRALGSAQTHLTAAVYGRYNSGTTVLANALNGGGAPSRVSLAHDNWDQSGSMSGNVFGAETRPRNVAFSGVIKF